jgi:hypothetical protein
MKFNIQIDDESVLYEVLDDLFIGMLKRELRSMQESLDFDGLKHSDDVKEWKKNVKALKILIEYYGGNYGADSN